jgi:uncharacterized surface protein with fasciclin (FAS1) repeats
VDSAKLGSDESLDHLLLLSNTGAETVRKIREYRCLQRDAIAFYRIATMDLRRDISKVYAATLPMRIAIRKFVNDSVVLDRKETLRRFDDAWGVPLAGDLVFLPNIELAARQTTIEAFAAKLDEKFQAFKTDAAAAAPIKTVLKVDLPTLGSAGELQAAASARELQDRALYDLTAVGQLEQALAKMNAEMATAKLNDTKRLNILLRKIAADDGLASRRGEASFLSELASQLDATGQSGRALRELDCDKLDLNLASAVADGLGRWRSDQLSDVQRELVNRYVVERSRGPSAGAFVIRAATFVREDVHGTIIRAFISFPTAAQTFIVTMLFGSLGALSLQALRLSSRGYWGGVLDPSWGEIVISMWLGMAAAIIVYLLASIGLLVVSDGRSNAGEVSSVGASLVALLGFVSGLLNDEAFGRIRRFGLQFFEDGTTATKEAETSGPNAELVQRLHDAGCARFAELARLHCLGTTLAPKDHFTLFVPADASFDARPLSEWRDLADPKLAVPFTAFVNHRLVDEASLTDEDLLARTELTMADGSVIPVEKTGNAIRLGGEQLETAQPYTWRNGIIYVTRP